MKFSSTEFVKSAVKMEQFPEDTKPLVAFFGRSNVGKSSLINSLTDNASLSRTSRTPGRTQTLNLFLVDRKFYLVDLPGYGYAKLSGGQRAELEKMIFDFIDGAKRLVLAVVIVDAFVGPTPLDIQLLIHLEGRQIPFVVIGNKIDKLSQAERSKFTKVFKEQLPNAAVIPHSSKTTEGRSDIRNAIIAAVKT